METHQTVLNFISNFTSNGTRQEIIETFTSGCCYWFAHILFNRFHHKILRCDIMYDAVANHWGCKINDFVYDITGDITNKYNWEYWNAFIHKDDLLTARLFRECINF